MGNGRATFPPRYVARLGDLRRYHVVTARCPFCRHTARKRLWELGFGSMSPNTFLKDIEARLRCMRCGLRGSAMLVVTVTEEDD